MTRRKPRLHGLLHGLLRGLGGRIALMCLLAAAPMLVLLLAAAAIERREAVQAAEARALDLARLGSEQQREMVAEIANVLRLLAAGSSLRSAGTAECNTALDLTVKGDPRLVSLDVVGHDGAVLCSSWTDRNLPNIGDRPHVRQALHAAPGDPPATAMIISRITGRPILVEGLPLPPDQPEAPPPGAVVASLNMNWLSRLAARITGPVRHVAMVIDPASGVMLGSSAAWVAPVMATRDPRFTAAFARFPDGGVFTAGDGDGTPMIFGFAPIATDDGALMLAVGLARADVLAQANARIWFGAALALVALLAAIALAWAGARTLVLRPIDALAAAADRFGTGDLAARVPTATGITELLALARAFNRMAERLETRTGELAATQAELAVSEAHHRLLADSATDMITLFGPDFRRRYVSTACRDLLGYAQEELVGNQPGGIVHPDDWLLLDATLNAPLKAGQETARGIYRALRKDGRCIWLESSGRRLADGSGFVVVTRDISERKAFEEQLEAANRRLEELAGQDPLTGLANRRRFDEILAAEHRRARRLALWLSVAIIDADCFKAFNDRYGHPAGDTCLQAVAGAIEGALHRPGDLAARLGGEEFIVLLPDTDVPGAARIAHRIRRAVRDLGIVHAGSEVGIVTVSLGVASTAPDDGSEPPALIAAADRALYAAKRSGRDAVRVGSL